MSFRAAAALAIAQALLAACGSPPSKGEPTAPTATLAAAPATPAPAPPGSSPTASKPAAISLVGKWTSPKCEKRGYVRNLELMDGGRFRSDDRVSPCPPNVDCVWSGIIERQGAWSQEGAKVSITVDKDRNPPRGEVLPSSLELSGAELVEVQGSTRCSYTKQ